MVFSSIPAYLDPSNWQQQQLNHHHHQQGGVTSTSIPTPNLPPPQLPPQHVGGGGGSIRPGSMAEQARLANIPIPEAALKCPRCESTNTKFCYFNNYSLSQPRHFCKTCRRYWTRGGALRSVPVGGGCRRNNKKTTKGGGGGVTTSKSSSTTTISTSAAKISNDNSMSTFSGLPLQIPTLPFMSPLDHHYGGGVITQPPAVDQSENIMTLSGGGGGVVPSLFSGGGIIEPWRLHHHQQPSQFPFLDPLYNLGFDLSPSSGGFINCGGLTSPHIKPRISASMLAQMASVKMEDNNNRNNNNNINESSFSRQILGISGGNEQWSSENNNNGGGGAWSDISASFSCSSTSNTHL